MSLPVPRRLRRALILSLSGLVLAFPLAAETSINAVTLSTAGLAMIEAEGQLGVEPMRLSVARGDIDDFLKSLWVLDPAGGVPYVTMTGPGSFEDAFAHFPFGPEDVTDPVRLFGTMVGAPLVVERRGESWQGLNMGVTQRPGEHGTINVLNLQGDDGVMHSFVMDDALGVRFAEAADQATLTEALRAWRGAANPRRIELTLDSDNETPREVGLVYLQNAPLWRTAWRAVDTPEGIRLIGWAVVENTTGIDWQDVQLTLATGSVRAIEAQLYARTYARREQALEPQAAPPMVTAAAPLYRGAIGAMAEAAGAPSIAMQDSMASVQVTADDGDSFSRFTLDTPVSLPAGQMMSVPFLSELLPDARLVLYRGGQGDRNPVIALSLENPLPLRLPAGVLTLYEDGRGHAGDAMIPELAPGATEVVDFARDTAVEVREESTNTETLREMRIVDGILTVTEDLERRVTYRIEGAPDAEREVTIDHPRNPGWNVSSTTGAEERPDAWRWVVAVGAGERASLTVTERQPRLRRMGVIDMDLNTLAYWEGRAEDAQVRELLAQVGQLRREILDAENEQRRQAGEVQTLEREQQRLVSLIVQLGDDSQANRDRRARVDAIDGAIAEAQAASEAAAQSAVNLRARISALLQPR
ncbi:DUF4139 domain-containing protein [Pararhodobacter aggregans]|uniref:Uncharacterized protein n=1 Tax=Pararhodobacter aggregans TaxID=404875 RepID=A0A2T7UMJ3_9RHOB|nr:DUF4139 domain-containing protein [Pararhodobacter aggregans]PTW99178.1 uncharacterized protein DUF4139 [Pararhodobacter aggregans]PVE45897.1 hypothetical protein DDE23_18960 [Pararhodobacter aggregans]